MLDRLNPIFLSIAFRTGGSDTDSGEQKRRKSDQVRWNAPYGFKYEHGRLVLHPQDFETLRLILGFCLSCGARRMSETAVHLVDSVLPMKPVRQWVLTFPVPIRLCLAVRPKILTKALEISHAAITKYYRKKANANGAKLTAKSAKTGAVTLIQRFDLAPSGF